MDIDKIALTLANGDTERAEIKAYYIRSMLNLGTTLTPILLASYFLNVFIYALLIILSLWFFRTKAGGCHSNSVTLCKVLSFFIIVGLALLVSVVKISNQWLFIWSVIILLFGLYMIDKVVPLDSPQRPIICLEFRKQIKIKAYIFFIILIASIYVFGFYGYLREGFAVLLSLSLQLFLMTKLGYWVGSKVDNFFNVR